MLTHRKKQEILDSIAFMPGHKQKMIDLFRRIDTVSQFVVDIYGVVRVPSDKTKIRL